MTEIRKRKTAKPEEQPLKEAATVTLDTQTIEIQTDVSLLYPPKRAMDAVGLDPIPLSETVHEELPLWRKFLPLVPIGLALVLVVVTIVALSV